jgi:spore coat polysaccharide biosynthesis protein SpsF
VEINEALIPQLEQAADSAIVGAIQSFQPHRKWDLTFTRGLLIQIPPAELHAAYRTLYECSNRSILIAEYYSPKPVEVEYRGEMGLLWKRDFAGEMLDSYSDLRLIDYGFVYSRDPNWPQDDVTWFLLEKRQ